MLDETTRSRLSMTIYSNGIAQAHLVYEGCVDVSLHRYKIVLISGSFESLEKIFNELNQSDYQPSVVAISDHGEKCSTFQHCIFSKIYDNYYINIRTLPMS